MSYEDQLQPKLDALASTVQDSLEYELENLDGYIKALASTVQDRLEHELDEEDFQYTIKAISIKITESFALVRKYHDVLK
jgi:hypothetical protein